MKLFGIGAGRRNGNSEILLKEALSGAKDAGAEVEFVRMLDLDIKQCIGCKICKRVQENSVLACVVKDDAGWLYNKIMDSDGVIIASPVWTLTPPGYLRHLCDRALGPYADVAFRLELKKEVGDSKKIDERLFKNRPSGLICVGGAPLLNWVPLGLPLMHTILFSPQIKVVDQMQVLKANEIYGSVLLNDKAIKRAYQLGCNVAQNMGKKWEEMKYVGDEKGTCPVCHLDLMVMRGGNKVECAVCGIEGEIKLSNGQVEVFFSKEEQAKSRWEIEGKRIHLYEIRDVRKELKPRIGEIPEKMKKYETLFDPIKPTRDENNC